VEIYAMAQMRIKRFEQLDPQHCHTADFLLEQHFKHVDYLIDLDVQ